MDVPASCSCLSKVYPSISFRMNGCLNGPTKQKDGQLTDRTVGQTGGPGMGFTTTADPVLRQTISGPAATKTLGGLEDSPDVSDYGRALQVAGLAGPSQHTGRSLGTATP